MWRGMMRMSDIMLGIRIGSKLMGNGKVRRTLTVLRRRLPIKFRC